MALTPGTRLGPYEVTAPIGEGDQVLAKLGEGGMGAVYRATDTSLGRQAAIKVLPDHLPGTPSASPALSGKRRRSRR